MSGAKPKPGEIKGKKAAATAVTGAGAGAGGAAATSPRKAPKASGAMSKKTAGNSDAAGSGGVSGYGGGGVREGMPVPLAGEQSGGGGCCRAT